MMASTMGQNKMKNIRLSKNLAQMKVRRGIANNLMDASLNLFYCLILQFSCYKLKLAAKLHVELEVLFLFGPTCVNPCGVVVVQLQVLGCFTNSIIHMEWRQRNLERVQRKVICNDFKLAFVWLIPIECSLPWLAYGYAVILVVVLVVVVVQQL